jgi:hypothetical protein
MKSRRFYPLLPCPKIGVHFITSFRSVEAVAIGYLTREAGYSCFVTRELKNLSLLGSLEFLYNWVV